VGSFHWLCIHRLSSMNWFVCPLWGRGTNLESILLISPVADLSDSLSPFQGARMQLYNPFSGCRNHSALHGGWATHSSALALQTQQYEKPGFCLTPCTGHSCSVKYMSRTELIIPCTPSLPSSYTAMGPRKRTHGSQVKFFPTTNTGDWENLGPTGQ
jgi:hypothetical protein